MKNLTEKFLAYVDEMQHLRLSATTLFGRFCDARRMPYAKREQFLSHLQYKGVM